MKQSQLLFKLLIVSFFSAVILNACSKGGSDTPANPCAGITVTVSGTATDADAGSSNGSITATAIGSTGFTFSLNNGTAQASGVFNNLAAGSYTITAKNTNGCSGSATITVNTKDVCAGKTITVTASITKNADPCAPNGAATITATGSTGFTFSVDNGVFQASPSFSALTSGSHTFNAKDNAGCVKTATANVPAAVAGTNFTAVKTIITTNCAVTGCHNGAQSPNFSVDCNIVANADRIKIRAIDQAGTASQMPQPPRAALLQADQDKINAWITAGKRFTD